MTSIAKEPQQPNQNKRQDPFEGLRVPRTRARPSNTLFGSNMEHITLEEQSRLNKMNLDECSAEANKFTAPRIRAQPKFQLPEPLAEAVHRQAEIELERKRQNFQQCQDQLRETNQRIGKMEKLSHFSHPLDNLTLGKPLGEQDGGYTRYPRKGRRAGAGEERRQVPPSPEAARAMRAEVNLRESKNRRPQGHNYSLLGDLLCPGQDFDLGQPSLPQDPFKQPIGARPRNEVVITPRTQQRHQATRRMPPSQHTIPGSGLIIPANLRHKYGSHVVDRLLGNAELIDAILREKVGTGGGGEEAKSGGQGKNREALGPALETNCISGRRTPSPTYQGISTITRSNIFPGASTQQFIKSSHRDYNSSVLVNRDPSMPIKYRNQTDALGRWSEADVIQRRIMRAFDEKYAEMMAGGAASK